VTGGSSDIELREERRNRADTVQSALYRIAELAASAQDLQEFYREVHEVVGELMYANNLFIALYDEERQLISWPYYVDELDTDIPDPNQWDAFGERNARGTTAYVLRTGEPQLLTYVRWNELIEQGEIEPVGLTLEGGSWLGVPLKDEGRTVGALAVQSYSKDVLYSDEDKDLLAFVGQHVGSALSRARAIEETRQRNAELALINSVQEALAGELEMQAIYDVVGDKIQEIFDAQGVAISTLDETTGLVSFPYLIERGERLWPEPMEVRAGFTKHVLETREPLLINEGLAEEAERYGSVLVAGEMPKSALFVPLVTGGRANGAIALDNFDREHAFSDADQRLLTTLAGSLSAALDNARLVHETRQRNAELALINSVQDALAGELDMQAIYDAVGDRIRDLFDAQVVSIRWFDETTGLVHFPYIIERGERLEVEPEPPGGFGKHVLETRKPLLLNEDLEAENERYGSAVVAGEAPKSVLFVPLVTGSKATGLVSLQNIDREHAFSESDQQLLETLAGSLSVALENARLVNETRQRNAELALINSVQEALAGELEIQAIYDVVGDKIQEIFDAQVVDIGVIDLDAGVMHFPYTIERGARFPDQPLAISASPTTLQLLETKAPVLINDVSAWNRESGHPLTVIQGEPALSMLVAPLVSGDEVRGRISLQNLDRTNAFSDADVRLLTTLAGSLSVALENARLVHETRQRNAELALINSVQAAIAGELDPQAIYDLVGDKIREVFDAQVVNISTLDETTGLVHFQYILEGGERLQAEPMPLAGFSKHVMETLDPLLLTENVDAEAERYGSPVLVGEAPKSVLFVPLVVGSKATGVISLQNVDREHAFMESDQRLLVTLAGSLSVALENARLVHETRQRNAELALINSVQEAIAGELDTQAIYELVGDKIQEVFDAQVVSISTHDASTNLLNFPYVIERGKRFELEPIPLSGFRKHVMESREPLMIEENSPEVLERYGNPPVLGGEAPKSALFVPLLVGGRATGVVSLQNVDRTHAFTEADQRLLTTLAGSLSVALDNARLVHETRQRVAELATVNSVGQALTSQLELDALIELVGERVRETFGADIAYVALHDEDAGRIDFVYYYETGERRPEPPLEYGQGLTSQILQAREPLLLNRKEQYEGRAGVGTPSLSYLGVPILVGEDAIGVISVQSVSEEGRFGEAETGLLATIAANVGVAIHNARLFQAQREAEREYRELVEELPLAVYRDEPVAEAASEYVSPRVEELFGYPPERFTDPGFFASILHPEDRDETIAKHAAALARGDDRWSFEYRLVAADGRTVFVRDDARIVKDGEGKPVYVQGFMIDVTDQALAHVEIRRQKQYFESLVEVSPVAIVVMDAGERVTGWNPAATELFGWSADEAVGRRVDELVFEEEHSREGREVTREALEQGRAQTIGRRVRRDGAVVDVELMLVPLRVDDEHVGFYAIYHDITDLQRARKEAEAATQAKSAFLATMSHEIRTPMNAVIGMTDLLLGTELTGEQREFAEVVRSSGDALLHVIDDILDYSKIEAGKLELERQPFDLRECVEGALEIVAPRAWDKEIELGCLIDEDGPAGIVGDEARLRQVLLNLLSNAVKFTEKGGEVVVDVDAEPAGSGSYRLELTVRDTGIGIPRDRIDKLFASFSQVDASTTRRYGGTGLGLAISKRLVDLMGGSISVQSEEGKGSSFRITLTADEAQVPTRISLDDALPHLAGKRILVVDDNATNREIVTRHARSWGMEPAAVEFPSEALGRIAAGEHFDIAVLDMMMPDMDGITLAREIRRHRGETELPLVLLTSLGRLPEAISAGEFSAQLAKPLKASQLYNVLLRLVSSEAAAEDLGEVATDGKRSPSSLRILLAEDNAMNQKVALRLLERLGFGADVASNGLEALEALERRQYDVVLMDVQMPELDGLDASRRICERWPAEARPRIVAMTANALPEDREACFAAGMDDYVAKPIRADELAAALQRVLPLRRQDSATSNEEEITFDDAALQSLRDLGGDEFLAEVIDTFLAEAPQLLATLHRALDDADAEELRRAAHTLKSNSATLGAGEFSGLCRDLEQRARSGELDRAPELVDRIEQQYRPLEEALGTLRTAPAA
jgi:PAS domain S-box-containing protein